MGDCVFGRDSRRLFEVLQGPDFIPVSGGRHAQDDEGLIEALGGLPGQERIGPVTRDGDPNGEGAAREEGAPFPRSAPRPCALEEAGREYHEEGDGDHPVSGCHVEEDHRSRVGEQEEQRGPKVPGLVAYDQ